MHDWHARVRSEQGVAAVEAALVSTFLMPLVMGVLFWGQYFWKAQDVPELTPYVPQDAIVGNFCSADQLVNEVKNVVLTNLTTVAGNNDIGLSGITLSDITANVISPVVSSVPTLGATVQVSVRIPLVSSLGSLLPNNGAVIKETTLRLENVTLSTGTCH